MGVWYPPWNPNPNPNPEVLVFLPLTLNLGVGLGLTLTLKPLPTKAELPPTLSTECADLHFLDRRRCFD